MANNSHLKTHRFDASRLYLSDLGESYCGAHVGTEATYTPWQWSDMGTLDERGIVRIGLDNFPTERDLWGTELRCEVCGTRKAAS